MNSCNIYTEGLDDIPVDQVWGNVLNEVKQEYLNEEQNSPWIIGFSGGKDSTLVVHAVFDTLLNTPPSKRKRAVHIVSNDTMVESPLVISHLNDVSKQLEETANNLALPVTLARTTPELEKTFWVLLIGKGYPSPNQTMRWCTDRLKIKPTNEYIKSQVSKNGSVIILLGVRRDESHSRMRVIDKRRNIRGSRLAEHDNLPGSYIYRPIVDLTVDHVWDILKSTPPPWGGTHSALIKLYQDAEGGECPVFLGADEDQTCGNGNSRFGCWTCTVVQQDKSLQGFIDVGNEEYKPLMEFRDWLREIRNNPKLRQALRRNGQLSFTADGKHIPGPFTIKTRQMILKRLLQVQKEYGNQLISEEEIDIIYKYWAYEI